MLGVVEVQLRSLELVVGDFRVTTAKVENAEAEAAAVVLKVVFVVSAAWRGNPYKLTSWTSFSSFVRPGGEIIEKWPS